MIIRDYVKGIALVLLILSAAFIVIAAPPESVVITSPDVENVAINGDFQFVAHITNTIENLNTVEFEITNETSSEIIDTIHPNENTSSSGKSFSTSPFNTSTLTDGDYTLKVTATNNQESDNSKTAFRNFTIDNTPPASITNLTMESNGANWIKWNWTNPTDPDFDYVAIWFNDGWHNTSNKSINFFNATNLDPEKEYTIVTHTVDSADNINPEEVSLTNSTLPLGPSITIVDPKSNAIETTIGATKTFEITVDQDVDFVNWTIESESVSQTNESVRAGDPANFTYTPPSPAKYIISVTATNKNGSDTETWNWTVHPKTYSTGNRVWDGSKDMNLTYTWNPMSFYAFYYDLNSNVGSENLQITLHSKTDRNIDEGNLIYSTTPESVKFNYDPWGSYNVIGFMAEKYFAGYTSATLSDITGTPVSTLNSKQLHRVLMDDDTKRAIYAGSTLTLTEGYVLKIKDVDITGGKTVLVSLLKDGSEVDSTAVQAGNTYVYTKRVGSVSDLPIIAAHIDTVFAGTEANAAFIRGIFQISENYTSVNNGDRYGIMEVTSVSDAKITMENKNSLSLSPNSVNDVMGDIKFIVADNDTLRFAPMVKKSGTYEVRGTISQDTDKSFDWDPLNFEGFYYNLDDGVGTEKLSLTRSGTTVDENNLVYTTTPQSVSFKYKNFGTYNVIGFMADKYFAGYTADPAGLTSTAISTIDSKQLHKVLIDDDTQRSIYAGSTLTLNEGYVLKIKDVDITGGKIVLLSLLKDGSEVDTTAIEAGKTYIYTKKVGTVSDLPVIAAHIETVFAGKEANAAFIKGIFQISENYTSVNQGDRFGIMEVSGVSNAKIQMKNPSSLTLSPASTVDVMGNIKLKVADDSNAVRFYPFIMVNGSIVSVNQLAIDVPANPTARDTISIAVTAGGVPIEGSEISIDNIVIGTTNTTGQVNYTLPRSGMYNITATKLGYERATKTIQAAEYIENKLSIEVPAVIDQGVPVTIQVLSNGTAIAGANVTLDGEPLWTTDANGTLNYSFNISGTHNLGASKDKYISVVREISIRMPFSEYKALDINITPNVVFTNQNVLIRSNITNAGTKKDTLPVDLIINNTVVDNRSVTLGPGEIKEINFTRNAGKLISPDNDTLPGNYSVEILGQKGVVEVKEEPLNYLLIGGILTGLGAIIIYVLTAKSKISLDAIRNYINIEAIKRKLDMLVRSGKRGL